MSAPTYQSTRSLVLFTHRLLDILHAIKEEKRPQTRLQYRNSVALLSQQVFDVAERAFKTAQDDALRGAIMDVISPIPETAIYPDAAGHTVILMYQYNGFLLRCLEVKLLVLEAILCRRVARDPRATARSIKPKWSHFMLKESMAALLNMKVRELNKRINDGTYTVESPSQRQHRIDLNTVPETARKRFTLPD